MLVAASSVDMPRRIDVHAITGRLIMYVSSIDPTSAAPLTRRGREAVATRYRWAPEGEKLCRLYAELVGAGQGAPVAAAKQQK